MPVPYTVAGCNYRPTKTKGPSFHLFVEKLISSGINIIMQVLQCSFRFEEGYFESNVEVGMLGG